MFFSGLINRRMVVMGRYHFADHLLRLHKKQSYRPLLPDNRQNPDSFQNSLALPPCSCVLRILPDREGNCQSFPVSSCCSLILCASNVRIILFSVSVPLPHSPHGGPDGYGKRRTVLFSLHYIRQDKFSQAGFPVKSNNSNDSLYEHKQNRNENSPQIISCRVCPRQQTGRVQKTGRRIRFERREHANQISPKIGRPRSQYHGKSLPTKSGRHDQRRQNP